MSHLMGSVPKTGRVLFCCFLFEKRRYEVSGFIPYKKDTFHMTPDQHSAAKHDKCHIRGMMAATTKASGAPLYLDHNEKEGT
ncbi:hypothetical protein CS301_18870 [Bacillus velezensis]|nr:hypothetical protein CS301_18870 [Bacillus velezensis]